MAAEIKERFEGKWSSYKFENGDKLLEAMGTGFLKRKLIGLVNPTMTFQIEGDTITVATVVGPKTITVSFKLGEEYDVSPPPDDKPCVAITTWEDGKIKTIMTPKDPNGKVQHMDREIIDGDLVQSMTVEGVTGKRYFKRS